MILTNRYFIVFYRHTKNKFQPDQCFVGSKWSPGNWYSSFRIKFLALANNFKIIFLENTCNSNVYCFVFCFVLVNIVIFPKIKFPK